MKRTKSTYLALVAVLLSPMAANAVLIEFDLTLIDGGTIYDGSFSIDDSLLTPNSFTTFSLFNSFSISIDGFTYSLANAFRPAFEGVLTDGGGDPFRFDDPDGNFAEFCSSACITFPVLGFVDGTNNWEIFSGGGQSGTYSISRVPEPGTLALLGIGLFGMGLARRRKKD